MLDNQSVVNAQLDQERLHSLVNSMADGVIATDITGRVVLYNGAAINILDLNTDIKNKVIGTVMTVVDIHGEKIDITKMITTTHTSTTNRDLLLKYADDSKINLYISIAPVHLGYGKEGDKGFVVLLRDITHEKSLEEERNEFISVVSHELRTPIAVAEGNIGNAEFIVDKTGDIQKAREALRLAHDQIVFLAQMINDLSTLSRAERGTLKADREPINIHDLAEDLQKTYTIEARKKGLDLNLDLDPNLEVLYSSRLYVREILQNFITNALKYTEKGSVTLCAKSQHTGVVFEVTDTGAGIGKADQEHVFEKFFRSDNSVTRAQSGTGLGLYVTMKLAKLLGAKISLTSEFGHGSTFKIYVPNMEEPIK